MAAPSAPALPSGPPGVPWFGNLFTLQKRPLEFLAEVQRDYGDIALLISGGQRVFACYHPDQFQQVLVTNNNAFHKSRILKNAKDLLGEGLLTSEDNFHLRQRRLSQPAFYRERLINYASQMVSITEAYARRHAAGATVDVDRWMMNITLAIVAKTLFSADIDSDKDSLDKTMTALVEIFPVALLPGFSVIRKLPFPVVRRYRTAKAKLNDIIYKLVAERRASKEDTGDLLSMLLLAQDEDTSSGMTDVQVRDEAVTLFLAGHETTSVATTWAWYLLAKHPEIQQRVYDESVSAGELGYHALAQLKYTEAVLAEAMRLYPPAWNITRRAVKPVQVGPYQLEPGNVVSLCLYHMHHDARWYPEPERFDPDRHLGDNAARPKYAYLPFGAGPRQCIGERFAWMEGTLILASLIRHWRFALAPETDSIPRPLITLRPRNGMKLLLQAR